jgi:Fe-S-cluster containining protein
LSETPGQFVKIEVRVNEQHLVVEAPTPPKVVRVDELLPLFVALIDAEVDRAAAQASMDGKSISCRKGCSACCRAQPVPVTPPEAYALLLLVEALPEPTQSQIRDRFDRNVRVLEQAELIGEYFRPRSELTMDNARAIAMKYFSLRLCCPFLIEDACGIYERRPFVCRQYLVTSPAELCDNPFEKPVEVVPISLKPATATLRTWHQATGTAQVTVPLALALKYAEANRAELEQEFDSESLARQWINHLCGNER